MASSSERGSDPSTEPRPASAGAVPAEARDGSETLPAGRAAHPDHPSAASATDPSGGSPAGRKTHRLRRWLLIHALIACLVVGGYFLYPSILTMLNTVSTDDAYVNGHVTLVAPRVAGQVSRVLVDDNYRVKKGALVVQLDKEPYQVQVDIKKAAVAVAETDLAAAQAQVRGLVAQGRSQSVPGSQHAIEDVHTQIANLRANVATLQSRKATLELAQANLKRGEELLPSGGISKEDLDQRRQAVKVDEAAVDQALQAVYATRVGLGLPAQPAQGHDLGEVPADLDQTFSSVRQALGPVDPDRGRARVHTAIVECDPEAGHRGVLQAGPRGQYRQDHRHGSIPNAPAVKQAEAKLQQARARPGSGQARTSATATSPARSTAW